LPQLFTNRRLVPILLLSVMFFMNMLDIYLLNSWQLTHGVGLDVQAAIAVGVTFRLGGMFGTVGLGIADRTARLPPHIVSDPPCAAAPRRPTRHDMTRFRCPNAPEPGERTRPEKMT
jgi:hypothetical protein